jgi:hypothetical protein
MSKGPKFRGGPPPGPRVNISHDAMAAKLKAMNAAGDHAGVMAFETIARSSPALLSAVADAAKALGDYARSEALRRDILKMEPGHPSTTNNLIVLLIRRDAPKDADHIEARHNLGLILLKTGRWEEAAAEAGRVLMRKPDHLMSQFVLGLALLGQGKYEAGWPAFESRTAPINGGRNIAPPPVQYPAWQGEPLAGKSIMVWMEQGLGDEIMMARYPALLKAAGAAKVTLISKPNLAPLFGRLKGVDAFYVAEGSFTLPPHDYWTYPMSMPKGVGTRVETIPAAIPYLEPTASARQAWASLETPPGTRLRVGVVWKGSATLVNDHNRSLPDLSVLAPLWDIPGLTFYSLQKGQGEDEAAAPPAGQPLIDLGPRLTDLNQTAAAIEQMDVIVSVDTAAAHLAGALGIPGLVMLPVIAQDWRWMQGRSDSPWYPSLTLFRQTAPQDWAPVVAAMAGDLAARAAQSDRL